MWSLPLWLLKNLASQWRQNLGRRHVCWTAEDDQLRHSLVVDIETVLSTLPCLTNIFNLWHQHNNYSREFCSPSKMFKPLSFFTRTHCVGQGRNSLIATNIVLSEECDILVFTSQCQPSIPHPQDFLFQKKIIRIIFCQDIMNLTGDRK